MSINHENPSKFNSQEKTLITEARKRIQKIKENEQKARLQEDGDQPAHFDKVDPEELLDDDISFFIELESGRLNTVLVRERLQRLKEEEASESRLEFMGYIANQVTANEWRI